MKEHHCLDKLESYFWGERFGMGFSESKDKVCEIGGEFVMMDYVGKIKEKFQEMLINVLGLFGVESKK
jgi:hypothetical protein